MTLPKITAEGILSTLSQARRLGSPGDFVLDWIEKMNVEENQGHPPPRFCGGAADFPISG